MAFVIYDIAKTEVILIYGKICIYEKSLKWDKEIFLHPKISPHDYQTTFKTSDESFYLISTKNISCMNSHKNLSSYTMAEIVRIYTSNEWF